MTANYNKILGILWMLFHCLLTPCVTALSKLLIKNYHTFQITFFHNITAFLIFLPWILYTKKIELHTQNIKLHIARVILGFIALSLYYYSLHFVPLIEVKAIGLLGPIIKSLLAVWILKEHLKLNRVMGLTIALIGALIIVVKPQSFNKDVYKIDVHILLTLLAYILWSLSNVIIKLLNNKDSQSTQLFYFLSLTSLISLPLALKYWKLVHISDIWIIGLCGTLYLLNTISSLSIYKYIDITIAMPFSFCSMIFTVVIAKVFFQESLTFDIILGSLIIFASSLYVSSTEIRTSRAKIKSTND